MSEDAETDAARARLAVLVRRLRAPSARTWAHHGRADAIRRLADELAAITAPGHAVPDVPAHAWGDVVTVLANDAFDVGGHAGDVRRLLDEALEATR